MYIIRREQIDTISVTVLVASGEGKLVQQSFSDMFCNKEIQLGGGYQISSLLIWKNSRTQTTEPVSRKNLFDKK